MLTDEHNLAASVNDNFKELESACPDGNLKSRKQSGSLAKEDRKTSVMHVDLAAFEPSADGNKHCLVAAVTIEVDKESKLFPIFVPMPKKDSASALAALKEALTLCQDRNLHQITGSRIVCIQADGGGEFNNQKLKDLCFDKSIVLSF